jgi:UDP-N-acetylmuramyl pentapeptide phosphotransferase/UDP-N-acetylglucosamine-1-phosphate transferase
VSLTVFASVTLTHAYNLSDGLNGLSSGYGIIALISLRFLAMDNGDVEFVSLISPFIFAILGFWIINILSGRIFLGDSGAYTIGHVVAWLAILFSSRNPEISPWALLLITIFPIFDLVFSVVRRLMGRGAIDLPDRCHMHHLVFDALVLFKMPTLLRSSLGSLILLLPASVIATFSCLLSNQTNALVLLAAFVVVTAAFIQKGLTSRR